jgi:hypothetical protein
MTQSSTAQFYATLCVKEVKPVIVSQHHVVETTTTNRPIMNLEKSLNHRTPNSATWL